MSDEAVARTEARRSAIRKVSRSLQGLHRTLLHAAANPEGDADPRDLFQRAFSDPALGWLRAVSGLIVRLDELAEGDELTEGQLEQARKDVEGLISDATFQANYSEISHREPEATIGLAEVRWSLEALDPE